MKPVFAGPLFTTPERTWNMEVVAALRAVGHETFLAQDQEPGKDAVGIFATDVGGIDWADGLVAIMDGADPDSGTCCEVGYAYGCRLDLPARSTTDVITAILDALSTIEQDLPHQDAASS